MRRTVKWLKSEGTELIYAGVPCVSYGWRFKIASSSETIGQLFRYYLFCTRVSVRFFLVCRVNSSLG